MIKIKVCTFFGHRECSDDIKPALRAAIEQLITQHHVDTFYVGNQGQFDTCVRSVLRQLQEQYPEIRYAVVLAYLPVRQTEEDYQDTMVPEGIEAVRPKYAIRWRNDWMLKRADYVIGWVKHSWGGAYRSLELARRRGKTVICLEK